MAKTGPWQWCVEDYSMATLYEGDPMTGHVLSVSPCRSCLDAAEPKEWAWGRCMTPSLEHARLIAAAPELLAALKNIVALSTDDAARACAWRAIDRAEGKS